MTKQLINDSCLVIFIDESCLIIFISANLKLNNP